MNKGKHWFNKKNVGTGESYKELSQDLIKKDIWLDKHILNWLIIAVINLT